MVIKHSEIMDNRGAVVEIIGALDSHTSPDFEIYVNRLLEKKIIFILMDAGKVNYVSSEGIGLLIFLQRKISGANGFFIIFNLTNEIRILFDLLGFDKIFRFSESRAEALQIMDRQIEIRKTGKIGSEDFLIEAFDINIGKKEQETPALTPPILPESQLGAGYIDLESSVVECPECKSQIRVALDGEYICPYCRKEFAIRLKGQSISNNTNDANRFNPMVVECIYCKSLMRITGPGSYQCPDCFTQFSISEDQTIMS